MVAFTNRSCSAEEAVNSADGASTTVKIRGEMISLLKQYFRMVTCT